MENKMVLSAEYIRIIEVDEQQSIFEDTTYKFEGEQRTGCDICTFGIMYDKDRFKRMHDNKPLKWSGMMSGGEWIECEPRLMILKPNTLPVMHNKKWVPNKQGYGYRFVIEWLNGMFNANILIGDEVK